MDKRAIFIFLLLGLLPMINAMTVYHKSYAESLPVTCPGCDTNECFITTNDINSTATATVYNGQLMLRSYNWDDYGTICCGDTDQQSCYQICPLYTEICEDCLRLSANATTAVVGDVIMITSSMVQRPHNGISLLVNGLIAANPDFTCHTASNVLGHQVVYYCTAMKSAAVTIQSHVVFCDGDLTSQQINITFKEQRVMVDGTQNGDQNDSLASSSTITTPPTTTTTTTTTSTATKTSTTISIGNTNPTMSMPSTAISHIKGDYGAMKLPLHLLSVLVAVLCSKLCNI